MERDLAGGIVRPLFGLQFSHHDIGDYTGQSVDAVDSNGQTVSATQLPTHLFDDDQAGEISGFDGGWDNFVKLGISVDTRDFEPDPSAGILAQTAAEISTRYLGSSFDYQRITTSLAWYVTPIPDATRLILALRASGTVSGSDSRAGSTTPAVA